MNEVCASVFTIGHSTHALNVFTALLQMHGVTAVADVRSKPYSRFNPQFNREPFAEALGMDGIRYVYLGNVLGGRPEDPGCYKDGQVCYDRTATTKSFRSGLARVVLGAAKYRIALMCAEKEPLDCHRTLLVSPALHEQGVNVAHIHADGRMETHDEAMDRLLDLHRLHREDLYATRAELIATAIAQQSERAAYLDDKPVVEPAS